MNATIDESDDVALEHGVLLEKTVAGGILRIFDALSKDTDLELLLGVFQDFVYLPVDLLFEGQAVVGDSFQGNELLYEEIDIVLTCIQALGLLIVNNFQEGQAQLVLKISEPVLELVLRESDEKLLEVIREVLDLADQLQTG